MAEDEGQGGAGGRCQNGRPYKNGNTREDGSYGIGKNRTPVHSRFAKGDGRARGRRAKGTRNLQSDWSEELGEKIEITEGGRKRRVTKQRGIVKAIAARAMKGSDRAAEIALRHAVERDTGAGQLRLEDKEIIARFLARHYGSFDEPKLLDDRHSQREQDDDGPGDERDHGSEDGDA